MAINKKLIHFESLDKFKGANGINNTNSTQTPTNEYVGNIPYRSVVFIKDTGQIWTHGRYYNGYLPGILGTSAIGSTNDPVYWNGSTFVKAEGLIDKVNTHEQIVYTSGTATENIQLNDYEAWGYTEVKDGRTYIDFSLTTNAQLTVYKTGPIQHNVIIGRYFLHAGETIYFESIDNYSIALYKGQSSVENISQDNISRIAYSTSGISYKITSDGYYYVCAGNGYRTQYIKNFRITRSSTITLKDKVNQVEAWLDNTRELADNALTIASGAQGTANGAMALAQSVNGIASTALGIANEANGKATANTTRLDNLTGTVENYRSYSRSELNSLLEEGSLYINPWDNFTTTGTILLKKHLYLKDTTRNPNISITSNTVKSPKVGYKIRGTFPQDSLIIGVDWIDDTTCKLTIQNKNIIILTLQLLVTNIGELGLADNAHVFKVVDCYEIELPTTQGKLALVSQIPSLSNYVTLNTDQRITGNKIFDSSISITDLNTGSLIVNGSTRLNNDLFASTIKAGTWNGNKITNDYLQNNKIKIAGTDVSLGGEISAATLRSNLGVDTTANYDNRYLKLSGGNLTGDITFTNDSTGINFYRNTYLKKVAGRGIVLKCENSNYEFELYDGTNYRQVWHAGNLTTSDATSGGTTKSLVTTGDKYNWNSVYNWYSAALGDTDTTINKWKEVEAFLAGITDTQTLNGILNGYVTLGTSQTITGAKTFSQAINGDLLGNASTADRIKNARTFTIGNTSRTFDGSQNPSWTLSDIASAKNITDLIGSTTYAPYHKDGYLPLSGGSLTGDLFLRGNDINDVSYIGASTGEFFNLLGTNLTITNSEIYIIPERNKSFTITLPSKSGTLALISDLNNYVDLTSGQTITGQKIFKTYDAEYIIEGHVYNNLADIYKYLTNQYTKNFGEYDYLFNDFNYNISDKVSLIIGELSDDFGVYSLQVTGNVSLRGEPQILQETQRRGDLKKFAIIQGPKLQIYQCNIYAGARETKWYGNSFTLNDKQIATSKQVKKLKQHEEEIRDIKVVVHKSIPKTVQKGTYYFFSKGPSLKNDPQHISIGNPGLYKVINNGPGFTESGLSEENIKYLGNVNGTFNCVNSHFKVINGRVCCIDLINKNEVTSVSSLEGYKVNILKFTKFAEPYKSKKKWSKTSNIKHSVGLGRVKFVYSHSQNHIDYLSKEWEYFIYNKYGFIIKWL